MEEVKIGVYLCLVVAPAWFREEGKLNFKNNCIFFKIGKSDIDIDLRETQLLSSGEFDGYRIIPIARGKHEFKNIIKLERKVLKATEEHTLKIANYKGVVSREIRTVNSEVYQIFKHYVQREGFEYKDSKYIEGMGDLRNFEAHIDDILDLEEVGLDEEEVTFFEDPVADSLTTDDIYYIRQYGLPKEHIAYDEEEDKDDSRDDDYYPSDEDYMSDED